MHGCGSLGLRPSLERVELEVIIIHDGAVGIINRELNHYQPRVVRDYLRVV